MQKHIALSALAGIVLAVAVATPATAQEGQRTVYQTGDSAAGSASSVGQSGLYVGLGLGQQMTTLNTELATDSGMRYSILAGLRINKNFRIEGTIHNTAKVKLSDTVTSKISGFDIGALGSYDITDGVALYGKVGVGHNEMKWNTAPAIGAPASQSSTNLSLGAGVIFDVVRNGEIRLAFERQSVGETSAVSGHSNSFMAFGVYKF